MSSTSSHPADITRERLIESHLPLVRAAARRYAGTAESFDDLVQVGAIGLIKAADRFDPSRGVAFRTFATPAIEGEIRRHLRDRSSALRIPRELQRRAGELRRRHRDLTASLGRSPTVQELAKALDSDERDVQRLLAAERAREPVPIASGEEQIDLPAADARLAGSDDKLLLEQSVRVLDEREQRIVFLRFHADMTEREIAREVGLSQAHVSRLLDAALAKLRTELARPKDRDSSADEATSGTRIARVGASQENRKLARYLDLPYHLLIRREHEGRRSWWSATVEELPGCTAKGSTSDEAVKRLRPAMEAWIQAALAEDREIPMPGGEGAKVKTPPSHSGRFLVRMPSTLHQQLAQAAEREQVSLNRFVTDVLASSVAQGTQPRPSEAPEPPPAASDPPAVSGRGSARAFRVALATNLAVVVLVALVAVALLVLALERGI